MKRNLFSPAQVDHQEDSSEAANDVTESIVEFGAEDLMFESFKANSNMHVKDTAECERPEEFVKEILAKDSKTFLIKLENIRKVIVFRYANKFKLAILYE